MSMAGASGDRWAIRTHPPCVADGAVDEANAGGEVAAMKVAVPPSRVPIAASLAICRSSLIVVYLSLDQACVSTVRTVVSRPSGLGAANSTLSAAWPEVRWTIVACAGRYGGA